MILAEASDAVIIGFQVRPSTDARKVADEQGIEIRLYSVIYDAINDVKDGIEGLLEPIKKEEVTGTAEVKQTFKISKVGTIAGCLVRDGKISKTSQCRLIRDGIVVYTGDIASLKRNKDDAKDVSAGLTAGERFEDLAGWSHVMDPEDRRPVLKRYEIGRASGRERVFGADAQRLIQETLTG